MTTLFDENGFCVSAGSVTIFNFSPLNREYTNVSEEYIPAGVTLPANSTLDAPPEAKTGYAVCRSEDSSGWEYVEDNRGKNIYSITDGQPQILTALGPVPEEFTLLAPSTKWDVFTGLEWVTNDAKRLSSLVQEATDKRSILINTANAQIAWLTDAVDLDVASESDAEILKKWKLYRISLNRLDLNQPDSIVWPDLPEGV